MGILPQIGRHHHQRRHHQALNQARTAMNSHKPNHLSPIFHIVLMSGLILFIGVNIFMPFLPWLILPSLVVLIALSIYHLLKSKYKLPIIGILSTVFLVLLFRYVVIPYHRFQQDDFLYHKMGKMCGNERSPNASDFIVCDVAFCTVKDNIIDLGHHGRDDKPLKGEIVKREWRMVDEVVHIKFYPYEQINTYCLK